MNISFQINVRQLYVVTKVLNNITLFKPEGKDQCSRQNILLRLKQKLEKKYISKKGSAFEMGGFNPSKPFKVTMQYYEAHQLQIYLEISRSYFENVSYEHNALSIIINKLDQLTAI